MSNQAVSNVTTILSKVKYNLPTQIAFSVPLLFTWGDQLSGFDAPKWLIDALELFPGAFHCQIDTYRLFNCPNCGAYIRPHFQTGKQHPIRMRRSAMSSASRTLSLLEGVYAVCGDYELQELVLTFPAGLLEFYSVSFDDAQKLSWKAFKRFLELYREYWDYKDLGCVANLHFWSSKTPLQLNFHIHALFLGIRILSQNAATFSWRQLHFYLPLQLLRDMWAWALFDTFGEGVKDFLPTGQVNIYSRYHLFSKDKPKILHLLKYQIRRPGLDLANWIMGQEDQGYGYLERLTSSTYSFMDVHDAKAYLKALWQYQNRSRAFGLWRYLSVFADKDKSRRCPVCGEKVQYCWDCPKDVVELGNEYGRKILWVSKKGKVRELKSLPSWYADKINFVSFGGYDETIWVSGKSENAANFSL